MSRNSINQLTKEQIESLIKTQGDAITSAHNLGKAIGVYGPGQTIVSKEATEKYFALSTAMVEFAEAISKDVRLQIKGLSGDSQKV